MSHRDPNRVIIFDTTLRDGEQSPGCSMTQPEKLRVAKALAELGVVPEQVEALAFAWLAYCFCEGVTGNLPAVTGAAGTRILGAWYPA